MPVIAVVLLVSSISIPVTSSPGLNSMPLSVTSSPLSRTLFSDPALRQVADAEDAVADEPVDLERAVVLHVRAAERRHRRCRRRRRTARRHADARQVPSGFAPPSKPDVPVAFAPRVP